MSMSRTGSFIFFNYYLIRSLSPITLSVLEKYLYLLLSLSRFLSLYRAADEHLQRKSTAERPNHFVVSQSRRVLYCWGIRNAYIPFFLDRLFTEQPYVGWDLSIFSSRSLHSRNPARAR